MQLGVGALARQNWSANACASADYGEADVIVSAKASGAQHTARVGRKSVLACGLPSVLQSASAVVQKRPLATQCMHPPPRSTLGSAGVARGSTRVWRVKPPRGQGRRTPSPRAFRAEWEDYKPARASGTRDDDDEAPTRQKELLLSVVIRPLVRRRHKPQKSRRVAAHEARRPQGPL